MAAEMAFARKASGLAYSNQWLEIIKQDYFPAEQHAKWIIEESKCDFAEHFNRNWLPISAVCTTEEIFQPMMCPNPFMHTTTTGGGAMACSAAIAAIHVALRDCLWERAAEKGNYLTPRLQQLAQQYRQIYEKITGRGLLIGMHFRDAELEYKVAAGLFKRGVLVAGTLTNAQTIRIEPALIISYEQMDMLLDRLEDTLKSVSRSGHYVE